MKARTRNITAKRPKLSLIEGRARPHSQRPHHPYLSNRVIPRHGYHYQPVPHQPIHRTRSYEPRLTAQDQLSDKIVFPILLYDDVNEEHTYFLIDVKLKFIF
jgi:hypothetical protein